MKNTFIVSALLLLCIGQILGQTQVEKFYLEKNIAVTAYAQTRDTATLVQFYTKCLKEYDFVMLKNIDFDER